jgi:hypothetical protein
MNSLLHGFEIDIYWEFAMHTALIGARYTVSLTWRHIEDQDVKKSFNAIPYVWSDNEMTLWSTLLRALCF